MLFFWLLAACSDVENVDNHEHDHNHGIATAVELVFTDASSGDVQVFAFRDGEADPILLPTETTHMLTVTILEDGSDGEVDITDEIRADGTAHQIFFLGADIESPASASDDPLLTITPDDTDENGLPIGIDNTAQVMATAATGSLNVVLRHLPPENGIDQKDSTTAQAVLDGGLAAIGGNSDVDVTFELEVTP